MAPSLSPLSDPIGGAVQGSSTVAVPPPPSFRPLRGVPRSINLSTLGEHAYAAKRGSSVAKHAGLRYEAKIQSALSQLFSTYLPEPQLEFVDDAGWRIIRPDGVLTLPDRVVCFEIKLQHMPEAWWQLTQLYAPVLARGTKRPCQVVEVVRSYDPTMPFQCPTTLIHPECLSQWIADREAVDKFGVLLWRL